MTKREILNKVKAIKSSIRLAQLFKADFRKKLDIVGYDEFINEQLEELKYYLELYKNLDNEEN